MRVLVRLKSTSACVLLVCVLSGPSLMQGASKRVVDMEWDKFWSTNTRFWDPTAGRYNVSSSHLHDARTHARAHTHPYSITRNPLGARMHVCAVYGVLVVFSVGLPRSESLFVPLQAISTEGAVELVLTGGEGLPSGVEGRTLALHDKNPALGDKVRAHIRTTTARPHPRAPAQAR